jgi:hypothetical protein
MEGVEGGVSWGELVAYHREDVVLEIGAYAWELDFGVDTGGAEDFWVTYSGELEDLGGFVGAA